MSFGLSSAAIAAITAGVGAAAGGATAIGKSVSETNKANRDRTLAGATQRYSPWTGLKANEVKEPDVFGNIASNVAGGAATGQSLGNGIAAAVQPVPGGTNVSAPGDESPAPSPYSVAPGVKKSLAGSDWWNK